RFVVAHVDADRDIGREAYEPGVLGLVGGAGLAGDRLADLFHGNRSTALNHAFHQRGDLVGRHVVQHLLTTVDKLRLGLVLPAGRRVAAATFARIVLEDGVTV